MLNSSKSRFFFKLYDLIKIQNKLTLSKVLQTRCKHSKNSEKY